MKNFEFDQIPKHFQASDRKTPDSSKACCRHWPKNNGSIPKWWQQRKDNDDCVLGWERNENENMKMGMWESKHAM